MEAVALLLRDLVAERTGIHVDDYGVDIFMEKLAPLMLERGFVSPLDYYYLLKYDPNSAQEWPRVVDAVSVRETFFWREFDQIRSLVEHILPQHFAEPDAPRFRIWSAACASGEEPLTIAMAIRESGLWQRPIDIFASDASPTAIATAQRGVYRERSFRNLEPSLHSRYFSRVERGWKVDPEIHNRVRWSSANLLNETEIAPLAVANVIFCRNVFIYFKAETIRKIVDTFARHIGSPGYLFVGAPESLLKLTTQFRLTEVRNAFAYVKSRGEKAWIA